MNAASIDTEARPATRRDWTGLAVIALPCAVYAMDMTVLNLALPQISTELKPTAAELLWMVDIYGFFVAGFLITMGTLGDRFGRRRLLLIGAAAFAASSTLAAWADSAATLIAARALMGIAGATLAPSTLSLIRNMFHAPHERQFAIGVWIATYSAGSAIGPLVGGVLLQWFGWSSVFLAGVPPMLLLLVLGPRLLPEYRDPAAGRIDPASVLLSLGAVLGGVFALKHLAEHGPSWAAGAGLALGLAMGVAFVRRQRRIDYPLMDLSLFARPAFAAAITAYALSALAMLGIYVFVTQYLQLVLGLSPLAAGLAVLPWSLGFLAGSLLTPRLVRHVAPVTLIVRGLAVGSVGFAMLAMAQGPWALTLIVVSTVVMSLALAPVFTVGNEIVITSAPAERAGAASALSETSAELSGALGIAVLGSLGTALYRHTLGASMPSGLDPAGVETALSTLGGALSVAGTLGAPADAALRAAAQAAFGGAIQAVAAAGMLATLVAAVIAARLNRAR